MKCRKGCLNTNCNNNKKRIKYKYTDIYCSQCGEELQYVCAKCYAPLPDVHSKYCEDCNKRIEEKHQKAVDTGKKVGEVAVAVGAFVVGNGDKLLKFANKAKGIAKK